MTPRVLALLIALLILAGCGSETTIGDCRSAVVWQGRLYLGQGNAKSWQRGERLGAGKVPACGPDKPAEAATVYRVRGVPPPIAVAIAHDVYLGPDYFPQLATHPLHRALFRHPDQPRARRCRGHWKAMGAIKGGSAVLDLATAQGRLGVFLHARTRVRGGTRFGTAYLPTGTRVRARGRMCVDINSGRQRFADVIVVSD
jgi:hypothetical protein